MTSRVFFADLRTTPKRNLLDKIDSLLDGVGLKERFRGGHLIAVKLHFGEKGNASYVRPVFVRRVVDRIKETGAGPFLTDTNTLYVGTRGNSVDHLRTAIENGFDFAVVSAPLIIADGLRGEAGTPIRVQGRHLDEVSIAREVAAADGLVAISHFKCHELTGFGGVLKNVGMGCASREGKLTQHSSCAPVVDPDGCTACGDCASACPSDAIEVGAAAVIDDGACIGCGHCIAVCPQGTINVRWNETPGRLQEKMVEHFEGAVKGKDGRCVYLTFINQVSPACDCYGHNDAPIVPDIGVLASTDPVAIDQAAADLVCAAEGFRETALASGHAPGGDKFRGVHPLIDWEVQLEYAQTRGLGSRRYTLAGV
ncbi:MAG TPA: 4Fe-4S ferredoxin [Deltaproteobacteria bacterium]|nr:MAG: 4Fe-4S ferredoxin [Deltaproteobacteria bacterium GWA2_55_82]OGQ64762.1 MAG: 4Fe-4S ferredoxin [Deltaproteobacteria bacterium RIFCSPLOWO2_02_FULL_55_12]OIJ72610.1 MAG: 4Fe-4S ferredoxin [Deltaproteobacteria bacterium GWC2_55_46]HBG47210.1 4Fe-4S ferredoxin [Deltaproteobacteria bacterium]HCY11954.1 4Fe-4S ferredoxin [Deltaproteobacteria bacterium]